MNKKLLIFSRLIILSTSGMEVFLKHNFEIHSINPKAFVRANRA